MSLSKPDTRGPHPSIRVRARDFDKLNQRAFWALDQVGPSKPPPPVEPVETRYSPPSLVSTSLGKRFRQAQSAGVFGRSIRSARRNRRRWLSLSKPGTRGRHLSVRVRQKISTLRHGAGARSGQRKLNPREQNAKGAHPLAGVGAFFAVAVAGTAEVRTT